MGYNNGSVLTEMCSILEREMASIVSRLNSNPAPLDVKDSEHIRNIAQALASVKKSMRLAQEIEMGEEYERYYSEGQGWNEPYGRSSGGGTYTGTYNGSYGAEHQRDSMMNDPYGRGRARDSRGRFMDSEMTSTVHDIMSKTTDERTREQLRSLLEQM